MGYRSSTSVTGLSTAGLGVAVLAGAAFAGPTWTPQVGGFNTVSAFSGIGTAGTDQVTDTSFPWAFGDWDASATDDGSSVYSDFSWNATSIINNVAFDALTDSGTADNEYYTNDSIVYFTADANLQYQADVSIDWNGIGNDVVDAWLQITNLTTSTVDYLNFTTLPGGDASVSYAGMFLAGNQYEILTRVAVVDLDGGQNNDIFGDGYGNVTITIIPLPSASALAGLGLLGLAVRRGRMAL